MAIDIKFSDLVGQSTLGDGGYIGDLLKLGFSHIGQEMLEDRLTQEEAGKVYVSLIANSMQTALKFVMEEKSIEADIAIKEAQLAIMRDKAEAELEKQWGYDVTRDNSNNIILGSPTGVGKIDREFVTMVKQQTLLDTEEESAQFTVDNLLPKQVDVLSEQIETSKKQQILLDTQEESEQFKVDSMQLLEKSQLESQIDLSQAQYLDVIKTTNVKERTMVEQELTGVKQRILLDTDEESKQYEVDIILPKQSVVLSEQIEIANRQQLLLDADTQIKEYERATLQVDSHIKNLKEHILLDIKEQADQYNVENILPEQQVKLQADTSFVISQELGIQSSTILSNQKIVGRKQ